MSSKILSDVEFRDYSNTANGERKTTEITESLRQYGQALLGKYFWRRMLENEVTVKR